MSDFAFLSGDTKLERFGRSVLIERPLADGLSFAFRQFCEMPILPFRHRATDRLFYRFGGLGKNSRKGVLDGQGQSFDRHHYGRPYLIRFSECRNITLRGITLKDSGMWVQHYLACAQVLIDGIRVISHANANNDGIDVDCCDGVRIANCEIDSGDDAIVLKSGGLLPTRNVAVTNCVLRSSCNALKAGTESNGGFENIAFTNCAIHETNLAGLALEIVDGGVLDGIVASNLTMSGVGTPIFIRLGDLARPIPQEGEGQPTGQRFEHSD